MGRSSLEEEDLFHAEFHSKHERFEASDVPFCRFHIVFHECDVDDYKGGAPPISDCKAHEPVSKAFPCLPVPFGSRDANMLERTELVFVGGAGLRRLACEPIMDVGVSKAGSRYSGRAVVVWPGGCDLQTKAWHALEAGAVAVILVDPADHELRFGRLELAPSAVPVPVVLMKALDARLFTKWLDPFSPTPTRIYVDISFPPDWREAVANVRMEERTRLEKAHDHGQVGGARVFMDGEIL